jgi:hypothetical protein
MRTWLGNQPGPSTLRPRLLGSGALTGTFHVQRQSNLPFLPCFKPRSIVSLERCRGYWTLDTNSDLSDNTCILEDLTPIHELGRHPYIHHVSPARLQEATSVPEFLRSGLICMTLNHRMNRLGMDSNSGATDLAERYYTHWGITIRSLSEHFSVENLRTSDVVLAGILTLLLADVSLAL